MATAGALVALMCAGGVAAAGPASATTLTPGQLVAIASGAPLSLPYAVAVDTAGDVFIANTFGRQIDEITASTGAMSVVAGGGATVPSTTPVTATSAQLGDPQGVAVNAAGTLVYIADTSHFDIEEVNTSTGDLAVIAGNGVTGAPTAGLATSSRLGQPEGVAVDAAGDVFIADSYNDDIEEVNALTGDLSVIAGRGSPGPPSARLATFSHLNRPTPVAVNAAGTLVYVTDQDNDTIDEITGPGPSGTLSVIAGGGITAPSTTPITATAAVFSQPRGVAVDSLGNVYIADAGTNQIDEFNGATLPVAPSFSAANPATSATVGTSYGYTFVASGYPLPTFALVAGAPSWLSINPTSGTVVGTPPIGTTTFTYSVTASDGTLPDAIAGPYTVATSPAAANPTFSTDTPTLLATVGTSYGYTFVAGGSPVPTFALVAGAPSWLSIDPTSGTVVGTPPIGTTTFTYSVTASDGTLPNATVGPFTVVTTAAPAAAAFSSHSPALTATVGTSYGYTFTASGSPAPAFALSGAPSWLSIGTSTGTVVGTPPAGNTGFSYTVTATNASLPLGVSNLFNVVTSPAAVAAVTVPTITTTVTVPPVTVPPVTVPTVPPVTVLPLPSPLLASTNRWRGGSHARRCRLLGLGPGRLAVQSWQRR